MGRFRILSLDGGGVRGVFSASVLATLEQETGQGVAEHFDLITGTSTGGVLALGLALGVPAAALRDFYRERGEVLFAGTGVMPRARGRRPGPEGSRAAVEEALRSLFRAQRLGEARCRLVLPTYDAVGRRIYLLKTAHHERFTGEYQASAVECALATSVAPAAFSAEALAEQPGSNYVDGGVWANCPVMVGVTEAVYTLGVAMDQLDVLSLGTMGETFKSAPGGRRASASAWNTTLVEILLRGQAESALGQAQLLTGRHVHRIEQVVDAERFPPDDPRTVHALLALGEAKAREEAHLSEVKRRFLNGVRAEPFVPKHPL